VNKEHIQSKPYLKHTVFSCCGLFAVNSGVYGGKASVLGRLPGLFGTVALPRFGLIEQFSPYPVPYEWLRDAGTPEAEADKGQARDSQNATVSHFNQHNTIGIFAPSVLYRLLVDKRAWNVFDGFYNGRLSRESAATNTQTVRRSIDERLLGRDPTEGVNKKTTADQDKGSIIYSNGLFTLDPITKADRKMTAGSVDGLFRKVNVKASKDPVQLHRKMLGNTATGTATPPMGANTPYTDTAHANTRSMDQANLSVVLQQESIQRTIKTLAAKKTEEQREHKTQFELLQQQFKQAEQLTNQDMRRLQQSIQELKNVLSARQQPVPFSPPRPPSFYGRLK
jgi:hypothetical protein